MFDDSYIAHFGATESNFFTTTLVWSAPSGPMLPIEWWNVFRSNTEIDFSLRVTPEERPRVQLFVTGNRKESLHSVLNQLKSVTPIPELQYPANAKDFNALADPPLPTNHLRVQHNGFHWAGKPLACSFRLFSDWLGRGLPDGVGYQIALRAHPTSREQERRVRKYLTWLEHEQPFTAAVRELQAIMCRNLLNSTWLADEYLIFSSEQHRTFWEDSIRTHFSETTGRIGFVDPPIETGDFSDWLVTGCHTRRDIGVPSELPVEAAYTFSEDEIRFLLQQNLMKPRPEATAMESEIFISYASADFAHADAARQFLEERGIRCWIAPRDINVSGLSYTEAIPLAMKQVRAVVVLLSPSANLSVHIPREIDIALERRLPIVPLRLVDILPAGQLEYLLRTCQWLDVFNRGFDDALGELGQRLAALRRG